MPTFFISKSANVFWSVSIPVHDYNYTKMKQERTNYCWIVLLLFASLTSPSAPAHTSPFTQRTAEYVVKSDISREFVEKAAEKMDAILAVYSETFPEFRRGNHDRFTIKIFKRSRDYHSITPDEAQGTTGMFWPGKRLIATFAGDREPCAVLRTLYHEAFHHFIYAHVGTNVPIWINEGLAEYFSESVGHGERFEPDGVHAVRLNVIQSAIDADSHIPFRIFLGKGTREWLEGRRATKETRGNLHYNQAWSLAHFLIQAENGRYKPRLVNYLRLLSSGISPELAFRRSFGANVAAMEKTWRKYVMELLPNETLK